MNSARGRLDVIGEGVACSGLPKFRLPFSELRPTLPRSEPERWQSGRLYLTRNQACPQGYRGFESLPLRQVSELPICAVLPRASSGLFSGVEQVFDLLCSLAVFAKRVGTSLRDVRNADSRFDHQARTSRRYVPTVGQGPARVGTSLETSGHRLVIYPIVAAVAGLASAYASMPTQEQTRFRSP